VVVPADDALTASFIRRAEAGGASALVVTLDTTTMGWRERDLRNGYLPFLIGDGLGMYFSDPVFRAGLARPPEEDLPAAVESYFRRFYRQSRTWADAASLRGLTRLPLLFKGILHPDDARAALDAGADGVIVSNHGGRQVDGGIAALDALGPVARAVGGRVPVLFDGGIRRGADVFKALALGARAVLLGRPFMYAMAVGGEAGVRRVLLNLMTDFALSLTTAGKRTPAEISPADLVPSPR
jgi:L-lactate dehydrogenase (cytochrome)